MVVRSVFYRGRLVLIQISDAESVFMIEQLCLLTLGVRIFINEIRRNKKRKYKKKIIVNFISACCFSFCFCLAVAFYHHIVS